jgi:integrase
VRFTQSRCTKFKPPAGKADHVEFDDDMPGFGMRFRNGGPGTYFVQYRIGHKDGRLSLGKVAKISLADAQTAAKAQFAMVAKRINPAVERARAVAATRDTIEPLIDDFIGYLERNGRAPSYLAENKRSLKKYFKSLHRFAAKDVNRAMVAKELSRLRAERGPIAADRSRAHLSKFFNWAIAEGLAEQNPTTGTNKTGSEARTRVLSGPELVAIWKALGNDDYGDICRLLILTGARRDEIGSLTRREINFDHKQIELPGARTKNGDAHVIPLAPKALVILKDRKVRDGSDFVFGRGECGFSGWSKSKEGLDKRLNFEEGWVLHDFRRSLSTNMHEKLKVPPHIVEAILNHKSGSKAGVAGVYNRAEYAEEKREALQKYAEYISVLVNPLPQLTVVR